MRPSASSCRFVSESRRRRKAELVDRLEEAPDRGVVRAPRLQAAIRKSAGTTALSRTATRRPSHMPLTIRVNKRRLGKVTGETSANHPSLGNPQRIKSAPLLQSSSICLFFAFARSWPRRASSSTDSQSPADHSRCWWRWQLPAFACSPARVFSSSRFRVGALKSSDQIAKTAIRSGIRWHSSKPREKLSARRKYAWLCGGVLPSPSLGSTTLADVIEGTPKGIVWTHTLKMAFQTPGSWSKLNVLPSYFPNSLKVLSCPWI